MDYSDYFCHETLSESGNSEENVGDFCQRPEPECEDGPNSPSINSAIGKGGVIGAPLAPPDFSRYRSHLSQLCASKRPSTSKNSRNFFEKCQNSAKCTPMFSGLPPALLKRLKNKTTRPIPSHFTMLEEPLGIRDYMLFMEDPSNSGEKLFSEPTVK